MKICIKTLMALAMGLMIAGSSVGLAADDRLPNSAGTKIGVDCANGSICNNDNDCATTSCPYCYQQRCGNKQSDNG